MGDVGPVDASGLFVYYQKSVFANFVLIAVAVDLTVCK